MLKIADLSDAQRARFDEFVEKWTQIGLCAEPADRLRAEHGIRLAYEAANLKAPSKIIWTTSPFAQYLTHIAVRQSVRQSVWQSVGQSVQQSVEEYFYVSVYGQHDASWLSFYDFFREVCSLATETDALQGVMEIGRSAGWFIPHEHICWITERHRRVCRNARGQLHSHDGMAVEYPDGWGVWAWNGVRVTEQIILRPDTLTPEQIAYESNAQVRQVMVERLGIGRVCQMFRAQSVDRVGDYELLLLDLGDGRVRPYLKMRNPSVGCYHIEGVAPHITTVQQAINWRAGDESVDWKPEVLT